MYPQYCTLYEMNYTLPIHNILVAGKIAMSTKLRRRMRKITLVNYSSGRCFALFHPNDHIDYIGMVTSRTAL